MVLAKYFPKEQTLQRMKQMKPKDKVSSFPAAFQHWNLLPGYK